MKAFSRLLISIGLLMAASSASAQPVTDRYFDSNGVRIRYFDEGRGTPVVLVHGQLSDSQIWIHVGLLPRLSSELRVIALDLRGHGQSDKPRDASAYTGQLTQDIVRLLDHLGIQRAHVVGYSLGGALVAKLLTEHPERFLTAIIGGSGGHRVSRPKVETGRGLGEDSSAFALYYRGGHRDTYFEDDQFAAIKVPVLGIVGSDDGSLAAMKELLVLLPSMKLVVIDGATHAGTRNAPARLEFADAIRAFIRSHQ